ncbi:MAG: class I SAM-dependent methyltransferase [Actinomycetota bacterium]|nr:class I SAM-dependent methyltransferase [Actinomycetota bacterium]
MNEDVQNPFATAEGARRYQRGRPFHHPRSLEKIFGLLERTRVTRALDVACGTGLSTVALADRADLVVGVDATEAMVAVAPHGTNIFYSVAQAERLPFKSRVFDLVTVASGVHWFQQSDFFAEAARVLDRGGALAFYDHPLEGAVDEPAIDGWLEQTFERRYPTPAHGSRPDRDLGHPAEYVELGALDFDDDIWFTHDEFVLYLMSNSNTISANAEGRETAEETQTCLRAETERWFAGGALHKFRFRGIIRCFRLV